MKKILLVLFALVSLTITAQTSPSPYKKQWEKVYKDELDLLPKSALEKVQKIYQKALKSNNEQEQIRCLVYQSKFAIKLEEEAQQKVIDAFKARIHSNKKPVYKAILNSMLAKMYLEYYNSNRWKIMNRTEVVSKNEMDDFRTWDAKQLFATIRSHYQRSLQEATELQQAKTADFATLIDVKNEALKYLPTLYDFLSYQAINFYKDTQGDLTQPKEPFLIDDDKYLSQFHNITLKTTDATSHTFLALQTYQRLLQFHQQKQNKLPFFKVWISAFKYIEDHAVFENPVEVKLQVLEQMIQEYPLNEASSLVYFELAKTYFELTKRYPQKTNQPYDYEKALDLCQLILKKVSKSHVVDAAEELKKVILQKSVKVRMEEYLPIHQKSKLLLTYRNTSKAQFSIVRYDTTGKGDFYNKRSKEEQIKYIESLPKQKEWEVVLPTQKDYKSHQTEIVLPALPQGAYRLIAKSSHDKNYYATTFWVSNLTLLKREDNIFQVLDRQNGAPVANVKVRFDKEKRYRNDVSYHKKFKTDSLGEFKVNDSKRYYSYITATLMTEKDTVVFDENSISKNRKKYTNKASTWHTRAFVFTDRSIYRPGQKVYFKTYLLEKKDEETRVLSDQKAKVILYDVNNQPVEEKELELNDFGTAAGTFQLPIDGLTGRFRFKVFIGANEYDVGNNISVEEYKRPKFEVDFKTVQKGFKINDSVTIVGNAMAFAGSQVSDAKVVYRVVRQTRYPRWCWWVPRNNNSQEIAQGSIVTQADGSFKIVFKAQPDANVSKKNLPTFYYSVTADVTDINGETRSASTKVAVGYHSLQLSATTLEKLSVSAKDVPIHLSTENLNGAFMPAKGQVKIYKLQAPTHPQKKRPWPLPDLPSIDEDDYQTWFPNETFQDLNSPFKWKKGALVYEKSFNTAKEKTLLIAALKNWQIGNYLLVMTAKDEALKKEVKDEKVIVVTDHHASKVADNQLFEISLDANEYQPNDKALIKIGSAAENMTVFLSIEKNHQTVARHKIVLNNEIKTIQVPVTEQDRGGFAIKWHWVYMNTYDSGVNYVSVSHKPIDLHIETQTFRDLLTPGSHQKWSFKISGANKEKATAELLASMYDASLDPLRKHQWSFYPIQQTTYRTHYAVHANQSFHQKTLVVGKRNYHSFYHYNRFLQGNFKTYGFSFVNNKWVEKQYLQSISYIKPSHRKLKDSSVPKGQVKVTVLDSETNDPLIGVNIANKKEVIVTNFDGIALLKAKRKDKLQLSYLGYNNYTLQVDKKYNHYIVRLRASDSSLEEVVIVGYGAQKKKEVTGAVNSVKASMLAESDVADVGQALQGQVAGVNIVARSGEPGQESNINIRGYSSLLNKENNPLYIVDGKVYEKDPKLSVAEIEAIDVLKDADATAIYGARGANGVIVITTKAGAKKLAAQLAAVKARTNFNETAFFYPQLKTNVKGEVSFEFTLPEDLTRWKLQLLAHNKKLHTGYKSLETISQKQLMVMPNLPRFFREGDKITISTKISNLSNDVLQGQAQLKLTDPITGKNIDALLLNYQETKPFKVAKKGNTSVSWQLMLPENVSAVQYKIVAASKDFSDGEQHIVPVLSNRMLVTETLPLWVNSGQTKTFHFKGLEENKSQTLKHHQLTLEMTSNPAWYAVQALPYLMEFPHECAEQTFARLYAYELANHVMVTHPKVKEVFEQWKQSESLQSNLEKNPELKSILISETPWLRDAISESEQKKRIALLFDLSKMKQQSENTIEKLEDMQLSNGGFPWFKGGDIANRYITQHIVQGYHHLKQLRVVLEDRRLKKIIKKAEEYLAYEIAYAYEKLLKRAQQIKEEEKDTQEGIRKEQAFLSQFHLGSFELQYLYVLSFSKDQKNAKQVKEAVAYYTEQSATFWSQLSLYNKGLVALIHQRNGNKELAKQIVRSLKETSVMNEELGRYWIENKSGWFWYRDPIVTHSLMIEVFTEIGNDALLVDELKQWLLKNKQTRQWKTTKATSEAVYALLLQGSDWLAVDEAVAVTIGGNPISKEKMKQVKVEAGTGYYKTRWKADEISSKLATVTLSKKEKGVAWGAMYWQYFEDLDKIETSKTPLNIKKQIFLKKHTDAGKQLLPVTTENLLQVGDLLTVRIELRTDREMEFIHMKDLRAAGLEPVSVISKYRWQDGLGYYQSTKDAATHFFFDRIPKGVYVFEYDLRVTHQGNFSNGITTIENMYAPEFSSHSKGIRIKVR
ncbi:alpha-2-macroglobulin family protein [Ochrovirga pacifica]|uniref:alpha-2-macroglobulin family protein n=1 Tax=Ochrovirga pacifica TaxID=1042376 RepID=UPI0002558AA5|nr:alpha-2-macroglobulin family protein [Ochrovirga pacifica]